MAEEELVGPQGTRGGGELPVEGTDTELRSSRSVTDTDSSPGLEDRGRGHEKVSERSCFYLVRNHNYIMASLGILLETLIRLVKINHDYSSYAFT